MVDADRELAAELLRLERALAERDPTGIDGGLADLIADDFLEIGRSGRTWTRATILELLAEPPAGPVPIDEFAISALAEGVVLTTYRTPGTRRASVWVRRADRWQIRFHQGTPTGT
jgi:hypothetical protein